LAVNHQANLIQAFFGDGRAWGLKIDYSLESTALSTIAPLALIPDLPEHFILMNGDVLTDLDLDAFWKEHVAENRLFTISAARREQTAEYGVLHTDGSNTLIAFEEKPVTSYLVSMGVYVVSRQILSFVPSGQKYGFDDLMNDMLRRKECVYVRPYDGYWLDIGRPDDYARAIEEFENRRHTFLST
jgi:NDP-sugar pyrophosphorylase family protein